ncbi:MAG: hypothetical protein Q9220_003472 [cf. Caloplaca sp. 1 TL-2023]
MPEIGEVARIVHYLHKHLVGKTLAVVRAQHDENVFGKVGTSAAEFEKALKGKRVVDARQQGKYFWLVMSSPPHPLFHFGMAGWWKIRSEETAYYKPTKPSTEAEPPWPPKYWKFTLETSPDDGGDGLKSEHAFVDFRRFARIRLIDCEATDIRTVSPLVENGPDPVIDKDILTEEWLIQKLSSKHVPIKALLLDQANISGIGNWVGDELLLDAKIHPEQYSNTLSPAQMKQLHKSIHYVCSTAVELKAESERFPEHWLFKHRWGKGKKDDKQCLPTGEKIKFLTVGGRTSAIVPSVQKKTGAVAAEASDGEDEVGEAEVDGKDVKPAAPQKNKKAPKGKKRGVKEEAVKEDEGEKGVATESSRSDEKPNGDSTHNDHPPNKKRKANGKTEVSEKPTPSSKKQQSAVNGTSAPAGKSNKKKKTEDPEAKSSKPERTTEGRRRRSARVSAGGK